MHRIADTYGLDEFIEAGAQFTAANDAVPFWEDGDELPCVASAAVTGKRLVQITAARTSGPGLSATSEGSRYQVGLPSAAGAAGAGKNVVGVAAWDAPINGPVTVFRQKVVPVTTSAVVTHGQDLMVAADGTVVPWTATNIAVGMAMNDAASGADCEVMLYH